MKYNTLTRGAVGGMLALALLTTALPAPRAEAATLAELQAQIQSLLAQIESLKSAMPSTSNLGSCSPFAIDITLGRSGNEVKSLQTFLVSSGHAIPAGATGYFGEQTRSALAQFQLQNGITPAVGYFGPLTRGKVNALCAAQSQTFSTTNTGSNTSGSGSNTPNTTTPSTVVTLKGEASFDNFDALSGDDTNLEEGQKNAAVMDVTFDVDDGDARINRVDLAVTADSNNDEKKPWKTFSEIAVYDGGTRLAKIDASNRSNWKENNPLSGSWMIRLSGLDYVVEEGDTVELTIKATIANSISGAGDGEVWNIFVPTNGIRAMDGAKVSVYTGDTADFVTIDIDREGSTDELIVKRSDEDLNATTLQLKDDARSGFVKVFAFDLDTDDSKSDIEIRKLPVQLTVDSGTVGTFMRDVRLLVDSKAYTKKTITDGSTNTIRFEFGNGEFVIDGGDRITVLVEVDFKPLALGNEGTTIYGSVDTSGIDAEGADDLRGSQLSGTATGEMHTMRTKGIVGQAGSLTSEVTSVTGATNDYATYAVQVKVTAFGQDVYIPTSVAGAVTYQLENGSGAALSDTGSAILTSNAKEQSGYFHIAEGDTKTITLEVTYKPEVSMTTARLQLLTINFNDSADTPDQTWNAVPANSYETATKTIVD